MKPRKSRARAALLLFLWAFPAFAQLTPEQKQLNLASFEAVWSAIHDKHWEEKPAGLDWQVIHQEYRPQIEAATSTEAARAVLREMLGRLHQTHFAIFPAAVYQVLDPSGAGDGWPAFEAHVLNGRVIV
ncbi:MAG: hypothetical protein M3N41_11910, partial [Acidobacteriota bacterium]|nr:hypothetical protein [Acidobacteriota bacterium]